MCVQFYYEAVLEHLTQLAVAAEATFIAARYLLSIIFKTNNKKSNAPQDWQNATNLYPVLQVVENDFKFKVQRNIVGLHNQLHNAQIPIMEAIGFNLDVLFA